MHFSIHSNPWLACCQILLLKQATSTKFILLQMLDWISLFRHSLYMLLLLHKQAMLKPLVEALFEHLNRFFGFWLSLTFADDSSIRSFDCWNTRLFDVTRMSSHFHVHNLSVWISFSQFIEIPGKQMVIYQLEFYFSRAWLLCHMTGFQKYICDLN